MARDETTSGQASAPDGARSGPPRPATAVAAQLEAAVFALIDRRGPGKTLDPTEVARAVGGMHPEGWGPLMQPLRRILAALAKDGRIVIYRKGKPIDPGDIRGIYRIGRAPPP
ncbi:DUF3253 domain-containing protein [Chelatococcus reniformis]|nr:DUF3253 domain-containing protein [Chelatococcus reniformis]